MHVLILPSWYPASSRETLGIFFREQAIALAKYGHQVGVIHPKLQSLLAGKIFLQAGRSIKQEVDHGVTTLRATNVNWFPRITQASELLLLRKGIELFDCYVEQYGRPDLVHVHSMLNAGILGKAIESRYGIPYLVSEHSSRYASGAISPRQLKLVVSIARHAARRLAVSQPFCQLLHDTLGVAAGTWEVIPNLVEQRFVDYPLQLTENIGDEFRFVSISNLTDNKRVHNLILAFAQGFANDHLVTLEIGGDGDEKLRLQALAVKLGVAHRVNFLGALDRGEVLQALARAQALVLASHHETFGIVVIEALALGKPVIVTRCGGPESIVRPQDGLLVPPDDVNALANAMLALRLGVNAYSPSDIRNSCIDRYSEKVVIDQLTKVYSQVLKDHDGRFF